MPRPVGGVIHYQAWPRISEMEVILPTDIHSLASMDVDRLGKMRWPVSDGEYFTLMRGYRDTFEEVMLYMDTEYRSLLIADFSFVGFLAQASHASAVLDRIGGLGGRVEVGPIARFYYEPDWQSLGQMVPHDSKGSRLLFRLRGLAKDLKFNDHKVFFKRLISNGNIALGIGSFSRLKGEYARKCGIYIRNIYMTNLFPFGCQDGDVPLAINSAVEDIICRFGRVFAGEFGFDLKFLDTAADCWKQRLGKLCTLYEALRVRRDLPETVLVTETARPINKTVAAAFRASERLSVGFHHGNSIGGRPSEMRCYNELSSYDTFVCPTRACVDAYTADYRACELSKHLPVKIISTETSHYKQLHQSMAGKGLPSRIKRVMLIGFPMNANRYYGLPGYFFYYQIALELKLVQLLESRGYSVLYKAHPECINEVLDLIGRICREVITEPFESCWERADAFIFKQTATTTFGFALCTNRPIVLLDTERTFWREDHYALIKRRCRMVPARMERDGVTFDEDALIDVLSRKPESPNDAYLQQFMYA